MKVDRRTMLAGGVALTGAACLSSELRADGIAKSDVPEAAVILTAKVKAKEGQEDEVKAALMSMVEPTRKEPGCLCYNLHQSKSDPTEFLFYEQWVNQAALDTHGKSAHMKTLGGKLRGKTAKGGGVTFFKLLA